MQQLESGVRYLDLRIALQKGVYMSEHMWIGETLFPNSAGVLDTPFWEIMQFIKNNPQEILILNVNALLSDKPESQLTVFMTSAQRQAIFNLHEQEVSSIFVTKWVNTKTKAGDELPLRSRSDIISRMNIYSRELAELDNNNHSVFLMYYHLVFVVKYRRKIIDEVLSKRLRAIFEYIEPKYNIDPTFGK